MGPAGSASVGIVGAGPAGLVAAEELARSGIGVTVFDQRRSPGNKFLVAGRGGLNISNSEPLDQFLDRYGSDRPFVEAAVRDWSPDQVRSWLEGLGEPAFVGSSGRIFPASMRATPLLRAWLVRLAELGVEIQTGQRWVGFAKAMTDKQAYNGIGQRLLDVKSHATDFRVEAFDAWLFALGGGSWPRLGSTGSWVEPFSQAGVEIVPIQSSNCGVIVDFTPVMFHRFAGDPIKNVAVSAAGASSERRVRGDIMVTSAGLEGGPIYAHSRFMRTQLSHGGTAELAVDLHPDLTRSALRDRLEKRGSGATATSWLKGAGLSAIKVALLREATGNQLPTNVDEMAGLIKQCAVRVAALSPVDRAISTAGGIAQTAVDQAFMLVAHPGCFVAGEMLDWDAPTGGYLLQASMSTGVAAARGIAAWLEKSPR